MSGRRFAELAALGAAGLAATGVWAVRSAAADEAGVPVTVIDVAGDVTYVSPGELAGVRVGAKVHIGGRELVVVATNAKTAALRAADGATASSGARAGSAGEAGRSVPAPLALAARGTVDLIPGAGRATQPRAFEAFKDQWPAPELPAAHQQPTAVALGAARASSRLAILGYAFGVTDGTTRGEAELRAVGSVDSITEHTPGGLGPLGADLDAGARFYTLGWNRDERTPLLVRAAELRIGSPGDPGFAIGRLRYAATSLGMLDGARAAIHVGAFELAAFGGLAPDPLSGKPDTSAGLFGAELVWDRPDASWQPRVAVSVHGSTWDGQLDERRASIAASAQHGTIALSSWGEVQAFPAGNPWNAAQLELTGAGASAEWRDHGVHAGLDVTFLRPDRSLRLAASLPDDWLCTSVALPGDVQEPCLDTDYWVAGTLSLGIRRSRWALDAVGSIGHTVGIESFIDGSGYLRAELLGTWWRLYAAPAAGRSITADWVAFEVGAGLVPDRDLDLSVGYRPERLSEPAAAPQVVHSLVGDLRYHAAAALDVGLSVLATVGSPNDLVGVLTTFAWRPRR